MEKEKSNNLFYVGAPGGFGDCRDVERKAAYLNYECIDKTSLPYKYGPNIVRNTGGRVSAQTMRFVADVTAKSKGVLYTKQRTSYYRSRQYILDSDYLLL